MSADAKRFHFSVWKAHRAQVELSKKIIMEDRLPNKIHLLAGADVAYRGNVSIGAVAALDFNSMAVVESQTAQCRTVFPYVPTLLSFREVPPVARCILKLQVKPDVFIVGGHGYAHPYRCGFASHLGLVIGRPTIGVANGPLIGKPEFAESDRLVTPLVDVGEIVGAAVMTKPGVKPIYVSIGHMISLDTAVKIVQECVRNSRIPYPLRKAHEIATLEKRKIHI